VRLYCEGTISRTGILVSSFMMRQALVLLVVVVSFGIVVPWYQGVAFLQPWVVGCYGCMSLLFVAPAAAGLWAAIPDNLSPLALLGRLAALAGYAWGVAVLTLAAAVVTLDLISGRWPLAPTRILLAAVLVFSLAASLATAALSALLARCFSAGAATTILRGLFLGALLVFVMAPRVFPESWLIVIGDYTTRSAVTRVAWKGSVIAAVVAVILFWVLLSMRSKDPVKAAG
jgi:hypothetical protein